MTRRRWIADEISGDKAALLGDHADHLARVLRARIGQEFDIATGKGVRRGQITSLSDSRVEFDLGEEVSATNLPRITLVQAIFKFDLMEWAIEKCTELGVSKFVPVVSRRSDSHLAAAAAKRVERWRRIALQASEQSRRPSPPEIASPVKLSDFLKTAEGLRIVLSENEDRTLFRDVVERDTSTAVVLAIGPEGGWTTSELQSFQESGWISASLGRTILRAETAAIAATAIVNAALTEL
jgi:16S rRNA (uracil1498-N3)-methyltransferase